MPLMENGNLEVSASQNHEPMNKRADESESGPDSSIYKSAEHLETFLFGPCLQSPPLAAKQAAAPKSKSLRKPAAVDTESSWLKGSLVGTSWYDDASDESDGEHEDFSRPYRHRPWSPESGSETEVERKVLDVDINVATMVSTTKAALINISSRPLSLASSSGLSSLTTGSSPRVVPGNITPRSLVPPSMFTPPATPQRGEDGVDSKAVPDPKKQDSQTRRTSYSVDDVSTPPLTPVNRRNWQRPSAEDIENMPAPDTFHTALLPSHHLTIENNSPIIAHQRLDEELRQSVSAISDFTPPFPSSDDLLSETPNLVLGNSFLLSTSPPLSPHPADTPDYSTAPRNLNTLRTIFPTASTSLLATLQEHLAALDRLPSFRKSHPYEGMSLYEHAALVARIKRLETGLASRTQTLIREALDGEAMEDALVAALRTVVGPVVESRGGGCGGGSRFTGELGGLDEMW
ncbi:MAG: hypothetical protein M1833_005828 [Piccolia ochrophora]|nr:MAG: hypothetical protein M1833_005828 [Piccolia ochrophora]